MYRLCVVIALLLIEVLVSHGFFGNSLKAQILAIKKNNEKVKDDKNHVVPYIIQKIERDSDVNINDICDLTIEVFFNEKSKGNSLWNELKLSYLRNLQYSDIYSRKFASIDSNQVEMFVARRVIVVDKNENDGDVVPLQMDKIINSSKLPPIERNGELYTVGEVIGFVDVTSKLFGLSLNDCNATEMNDMPFRQNLQFRKRPVLTNLAVKPYARRSGVATHLVKACEIAVSSDWNPSYNEIILQVEDDNPLAIKFYEKLGYSYLFADPTTRRIDTNGIFIRQVRSTKICMRKKLNNYFGSTDTSFFNFEEMYNNGIFRNRATPSQQE